MMDSEKLIQIAELIRERQTAEGQIKVYTDSFNENQRLVAHWLNRFKQLEERIDQLLKEMAISLDSRLKQAEQLFD